MRNSAVSRGRSLVGLQVGEGGRPRRGGRGGRSLLSFGVQRGQASFPGAEADDESSLKYNICCVFYHQRCVSPFRTEGHTQTHQTAATARHAVLITGLLGLKRRTRDGDAAHEVVRKPPGTQDRAFPVNDATWRPGQTAHRVKGQRFHDH